MNGTPGSTYFINFGYEIAKPTVKIIVRDIFYTNNNVLLYYNLRESTEISSESKTFSKLSLIPTSYKYQGYLIAYDKALPSCQAYVELDSCTINAKDVKNTIYINFMYKKDTKDVVINHDAPEHIIGGYLGVRTLTATIKTTCGNTTGIFPEVYNGANVRTVPSGQKMDVGMEDGAASDGKLNKFYLGGIEVGSDEEKGTITKNITSVRLALVHDVNPTDDSHSQNEIMGFAVGIKQISFIIPYKYINYTIKNFSIYKLDSSDIYKPGSNEKAKGTEIIDNVIPKVDYNIDSREVNIALTERESGIPIVLSGLEAQATLLQSGITDISQVIKDVKGNWCTVEESTIFKNTTDGSSDLINFMSTLVNTSIISTIEDTLSKIGLDIDGYILETVHVYSNVSDDTTIIKTILRALGCIFKGDEQREIEGCPDLGDILRDIGAWLESKAKIGRFVYTGLDSEGEKKNYIGDVQTSILGWNGLGLRTLEALDSIRKLDIKLEIKTSEYNQKLKLNYTEDGYNKTQIIGQTKTLDGIIDTIFDDIITKDISIWDINFTKEDNGSISIADIPLVGGLIGKQKYKFNGYVETFDATSGMRILDKAKEYYTRGFGGSLGKIDTSGSIANEKLVKDNSISFEKLNGLRAFAEETTYKSEIKSDGSSDFYDNLYYSKLNLLGVKNKFHYEGLDIKKWHTSDEGTVDLINVYTPIEIDEDIEVNSDNKLISQLTERDGVISVYFNSEFNFKIGPEGKYLGTTKRYISLDNTREYCDGFYVKFSFDPEYVKIEKTSGDIQTISDMSRDQYKYFKLSEYKTDSDGKLKFIVKAKNEVVDKITITVRAVAKNLLTDNNINKRSIQTDFESFRTEYGNICNDTLGLITNIDAPVYYDEKEFNITPVSISRLYDFRVTDVKDVNWKKIFRNEGSSQHNGVAYYVGLKKWDKNKGRITRNENEVGKYLNRTLPIGPYKSTDTSYVEAPKIGYRIAFDVKKSYSDDENLNKNVSINVGFFYIGKDATGFTKEIDLYYKNDSGNLVKIGSDDDKYNITFLPNDGERLLETVSSNLSNTTISIGSLTKLTLDYDKVSTSSADYQTFYGEYKLPNSTIVVKKNKSPEKEENILSNGYVGVIFDISSTFRYKSEEDDRNITYQQKMDDSKTQSNQWQYESYLGSNYGMGYTKAKTIQLKNGKISINDRNYNDFQGTVVLFDLDNRAATDHE